MFFWNSLALPTIQWMLAIWSLIGGVNSHLESNPIPARDSQRAQTNPVCSRTQGPRRDWDRTVFERVWGRRGSVVACCRVGGTECSNTCMESFEGGHHYLHYLHHSLSSVQFSGSVMSDSVTPWIAAYQASLSITNSQSLLKLMPMELVMSSSHLILCRPLLLLLPIPPSIRIFSNESALRMRWPKYWSFSFSISPSNEYPGLISFRMDWLDLLAV